MRQNGGDAESEPEYGMSEDAQLRLQQARDQLQMLAVLAAPRHACEDAGTELRLRPAALARCFEQLAEELDAVLQDIQWRA